LADETAKLRKDIEQAHFRIDELSRQNTELRKWADPAHLAGVAHGAVMEVHNKFPKDAASLILAIYENTAAVQALVKVLSAPVTRESTINLPSGPVHMSVRETKDSLRPWQPPQPRKQ
jgi:hypothetical protein